jgi:pimeloyl-ACP methyl ester carboxylesterase
MDSELPFDNWPFNRTSLVLPQDYLLDKMKKEVLEWLKKGAFHRHNEQDIFHIDHGRGDVILIIHGYPYSSFEWSPIIHSLSSTNRVIAFDLLGMGFSDKPGDYAYSYEDYVACLLSLVARLEVKRFNILAHDLGVSVVQELLAQQQTGKVQIEIDSIAFVNGGLFMDAYQPRLIQRLLSQSPDFIGKWLSKNLTRSLIEKSVKSLFGVTTQPTLEFLDQQWDILTYKNGKELAYLLGRMVFKKYQYQKRWISAMQASKTKMCFINGPFDPNSGEHMAKRYEELIPNPIVYRLEPGIGHWPHVEDPIRFVEVYWRFLTVTG